jgi:hypothetical protein
MWWNWTRESDHLKKDLQALLKETPGLTECPKCSMKRPDYQEACLFCMMTDSQTLQGIADLLGVDDAEKGVIATLEKLARLTEAVNTFPLGLLMGGEDADGKKGWRFVNLVIQRTSPRYDTPAQALLAGHEFYKEHPGFILEVASIGMKLPGPVEPEECDG